MVSIEKRYAHAGSFDGHPKIEPFYCEFGGHGELWGEDIVIATNDDEDGAAVRGLRVELRGRSAKIVDEKPSENSRYCGGHDSFDGLSFELDAKQ